MSDGRSEPEVPPGLWKRISRLPWAPGAALEASNAELAALRAQVKK